MAWTMGATGLTLTSSDVSFLDDRHAIARTRWQVHFVSADAEPLTLASSYLLRRSADGWRVLVYLNHQNMSELSAARASHGTPS